jgi:hypothetical protein
MCNRDDFYARVEEIVAKRAAEIECESGCADIGEVNKCEDCTGDCLVCASGTDS